MLRHPAPDSRPSNRIRAGRARVLLAASLCVVVAAGCRSSGRHADETVRHSALWGRTGETWDSRGRLPDFSFAGYAMGERPLPEPAVRADVTDFGARGDGVTDDTEAFRAAIAAVDSGAVAIPAGRYLLTQVIRIDRPGIVLRGRGPGRSVISIAFSSVGRTWSFSVTRKPTPPYASAIFTKSGLPVRSMPLNRWP